MKYLSVAKKYLAVFIGAVLFGVAAVKVKSATRTEKKAADKVREYAESLDEASESKVSEMVDKMTESQVKAKKAKENAIKKLDAISSNSGSVKSLLDEYNSNRV